MDLRIERRRPKPRRLPVRLLCDPSTLRGLAGRCRSRPRGAHRAPRSPLGERCAGRAARAAPPRPSRPRTTARRPPGRTRTPRSLPMRSSRRAACRAGRSGSRPTISCGERPVRTVRLPRPAPRARCRSASPTAGSSAMTAAARALSAAATARSCRRADVERRERESRAVLGERTCGGRQPLLLCERLLERSHALANEPCTFARASSAHAPPFGPPPRLRSLLARARATSLGGCGSGCGRRLRRESARAERVTDSARSSRRSIPP